MTSTATRPPVDFGTPTLHRPRRRTRRRLLALLVLCAAAVSVGYATRGDEKREYLARGGWPADGQAAYQLGNHAPQASPDAKPVPIASIAKVMTAYLALDGSSLDQPRFLTVTKADVNDTARRRLNDESTVAVTAGETMTRRQALQALLLPSANNVAVMIARRLAGSVSAFVALMNRAAGKLGMTHTHYTDPSGLDAGTVSTASDQLILAQVAMHDDAFAEIVGAPWADLPVVGRVHNTDSLLGHDGFVGIKTGSDDAAGGCFMFRTWRNVKGTLQAMTGVVLGQHGENLIRAGLDAGRQLADKVAPTAGQA
jgi:D-alanyl-D-alanine carboxypeptidase (penicillin-binding protein 5/6)